MFYARLVQIVGRLVQQQERSGFWIAPMLTKAAPVVRRKMTL